MRKQDTSERKGHKRKHTDASGSTSQGWDPEPVQSEAKRWVTALVLGTSKEDRSAILRAAAGLAELANFEENVDIVVEEGAIDAVVNLLFLPAAPENCSNEEAEKQACMVLALLAIKPKYQRHIADGLALPGLVALLKRKAAVVGREEFTFPSPSRTNPGACLSFQGAGGVARRAADAVTNLAHENVHIKNRVRTEGGIPPLVTLLESLNPKVQRAAAGSLRTLAFKNEENKNLIVECGALPMLIVMLKSEHADIHYEAVGVIGNLVHSSQHIKKKVLEEGALQPVISLLSSRCAESQREAALLLGQFATTDPDYKVRIVQRGAVRPLVDMLGPMHDNQLREMAAFALGRLAQNPDNQAGIVQQGGLKPLLALLDCNNASMQHNAAFAIYGLAENEDNIVDIICEGGVHILMQGNLIAQQSLACVHNTLKRVGEKMTGKVLRQLLYSLRSVSDLRRRHFIATALAHLTLEQKDKALVFSDVPPTCGATEVLITMLMDSKNKGTQEEGAKALHALLQGAPTPPVDFTPAPPTPQVIMGEEFVNSPTASDVSFIVDGKCFYAHRIALLASSDAFRAMFDGGYKEKEAGQQIDIPNIRHKVFEAMMRCIYTGTVEVTPDIAQDLLRAADQYFLDGLKPLCENAIAQDLSIENLEETFELAQTFHASQLTNRCVSFALEKCIELVEIRSVPGYSALMKEMEPELRKHLVQIFEANE